MAQTKFTITDAVARLAVANLGTPGIYYLERNPASRDWVIHLDGGGLCYNAASCAARPTGDTTSSGWPAMRQGVGIQSKSQAANPEFYDANHVYVPYLSSDLYCGDAPAGQGAAFHFRGLRIIQAIIQELLPDLSQADRVLLSGTSAGGVGVLVHLPALRAVLPVSVQVKGLCDSGWFFDYPPLNPALPTFRERVVAGLAYWQGQPCAAPPPTTDPPSSDPVNCLLGPTIYPALPAPLFVGTSLADRSLLKHAGVDEPYTAAEIQHINALRPITLATLTNVAACFAQRAIYHGVVTGPGVYARIIGVTTYAAALANFFYDRPGPVRLIEAGG